MGHEGEGGVLDPAEQISRASAEEELRGEREELREEGEGEKRKHNLCRKR